MRLDRLIPLGLILILVGLVSLALAEAPAWFWHPLAPQVCRASYHTAAQIRDCMSYNAWSGSFSDVSEITLPLGMLSFAVGWWYTHNCHRPGCPRIAWHPHPGHGHPVCRHHHPHGDPAHPVWAREEGSR